MDPTFIREMRVALHWEIFPIKNLIFSSFFSGEPEVDYPIFAVAPESSFSCDDKDDGMYADVEARCQV